MLIFFCKNWHEASFYIKEQAHKINLEFKLKKLFFWTPENHVFGFLKKKYKTNFFLRVSALIPL